VIHRYWHGDADPPAEPWLHEVIAYLHPDQQLHDWTDKTIPVALAARLDSDPLRDDPRHRANVARWWLLETYGGTWLDHDVIPFMPLPQGTWTATLGTTRTGCAVRLPLGHGLPRAMLDRINQADRTGQPVDISGDHLLQQVAARWPALGSHRLPFDAIGQPDRGAAPWAIHLWSTSARAHLNR
jgi:hypothetical protein